MYFLPNYLNLEIKTLYFEVTAGWVNEFRLEGKSQENLVLRRSDLYILSYTMIFSTNSPYLHCRRIDSKNGNEKGSM